MFHLDKENIDLNRKRVEILQRLLKIRINSILKKTSGNKMQSFLRKRVKISNKKERSV